jgi:hypothetical protein
MTIHSNLIAHQARPAATSVSRNVLLDHSIADFDPSRTWSGKGMRPEQMQVQSDAGEPAG